jgi:hypothetical protein
MQRPVTITDGTDTIQVSPEQHAIIYPDWEIVGATPLDQTGPTKTPPLSKSKD